MQITVSLTIDVLATADVNTVEPQILEAGRQVMREVLPLAVLAAPQLLVELDGGWIASRDEVGGMEGKVAVVATGVARLSPERQCLYPRRDVATFGSAEQLW